MFNVPLGSTVALVASICLYPWVFALFRACTEPRRAPARRSETPLVHDIDNIWQAIYYPG